MFNHRMHDMHLYILIPGAVKNFECVHILQHCANADVPDEVVADTDACLQKLRDDHKDALDGVDPDGELTEDEDEEAEDEAEDEGAEGAEV